MEAKGAIAPRVRPGAEDSERAMADSAFVRPWNRSLGALLQVDLILDFESWRYKYVRATAREKAQALATGDVESFSRDVPVSEAHLSAEEQEEVTRVMAAADDIFGQDNMEALLPNGTTTFYDPRPKRSRVIEDVCI